MKRAILIAVLAGLFLCAPAAVANSCVKHHCANPLVATRHLHRWVSRREIGRDDQVEMRLFINGKPQVAIPLVGLRMAWIHGSFMATAVLTHEPGPIRLRYVTGKRRQRFRFRYQISR